MCTRQAELRALAGQLNVTPEALVEAVVRASRVYEGLSRQDIDEIEELARHRALFDDVH
jgi:hypothetical protein